MTFKVMTQQVAFELLEKYWYKWEKKENKIELF